MIVGRIENHQLVLAFAKIVKKMLKKIIALLTPNDRKQAFMLMCMMLTMATLDMMGVASILPFMAVLANPEVVQTNDLLNASFKLSAQLGIRTIEQFLFVLGLLVFLLLVISLAFKALTTYAQTRFALMREYSIGKHLVESYLHQPYSWFLNRHSADLGKNILSEVSAVIDYGLIPLMTLIAQSAVASALLLLLVIVDPFMALSVGLVLGCAYGSIFLLIRGWINVLGEARVEANKQRFNAVVEAFSATKEVKVGGLEQVYMERFANPQRFMLEVKLLRRLLLIYRDMLWRLSLSVECCWSCFILGKSGSFASAAHNCTVYVCGYRLMPALQQIYGAFTQWRFAGQQSTHCTMTFTALEL